MGLGRSEEGRRPAEGELFPEGSHYREDGMSVPYLILFSPELKGNCVQINWYTDFYFPFLRKWEAMVRSVAGPEKPLWVEPIPNEVSASTI